MANLIRQPTENFWTEDPPTSSKYNLLIVVVSETQAFMCYIDIDTNNQRLHEVSQATVVGSAPETDPFAMLGAEATTGLFVYRSRYTLQGETSPNHDVFYFGSIGMTVPVPPVSVVSYLDDNNVESSDLRLAPTISNAFVNEVINGVTYTRIATSFDKVDFGPTAVFTSYGQATFGIGKMPLSTEQVDQTVSLSLISGTGEATFYTVPEDVPIIQDIVKACWPDANGKWVVTCGVARVGHLIIKEVTSTPPKKNAYFPIFNVEVDDLSVPDPVPDDLGNPIAIPTADGFLPGPSTALLIASSQGNKIPSYTSFAQYFGLTTPGLTDVINAGFINTAFSATQLFPILNKIPVTFTSTDPFFKTFAASQVTLTVGTDVYRFDEDESAFIVDLTNASTRAPLTITNSTISGTLSVLDMTNFKSITPQGALSIPLANLPSINFTGETKASGGSSSSSGNGWIIGCGILVALVLVGIGVAVSRKNDNSE